MSVPNLVVAALLGLVAVGTWLWQRWAYQTQRRGELTPSEQQFFEHRHRRRWQISMVLAMIGAAIGVSGWVREPLALGLLWLGILVALFWVILLATIDAWHSHLFYTRLRVSNMAQQARFQRDLIDKLRSDEDRGMEA